MMKNQLEGLMKQAKQMQENMKKAQEELAQTEVEGQAGAGLVKVVMNCRHDVKRVAIDPSLLAEDRDMLGGLVAAGINGGVRGAGAAAARTQAAVLMAERPVPAHEPLSSLDALSRALRCLPGVGPKAAQRRARRVLT